MTDRHATAAAMVASAALLVLGLVDLPAGRSRSARDSARSLELNSAERESGAGGYYEGLIRGGPEGARDELTLRLLGKPADWVRFHEAGIARVMPEDFLQFELLPDLDRTLFGCPFTTNAFGMRDRPYAIEKPPGVYRIAVVGSSMDMGWGIGTDETYGNLLEDWLNHHAALRGLPRRFEVLNFAVAAYGPLQRLESFHRKAAPFHPDLVIYSATMLDLRLLEIHLCGLLPAKIDLHYDFLRRAVADARIRPEDLRTNADGQLADKEAVRSKLRPRYWSLVEESLAALDDACRASGAELIEVIIPRVGKADAPDDRAPVVAQHLALAARHGIPALDLSATFDDHNPATLEIAAWDDHPNARGHTLLFRALARELVEDPVLYHTLFDAEPVSFEDAGNRPSP